MKYLLTLIFSMALFQAFSQVIEVTLPSGATQLVNMDQVKYIFPSGSGASLTRGDRFEQFNVIEDVDSLVTLSDGGIVYFTDVRDGLVKAVGCKFISKAIENGAGQTAILTNNTRYSFLASEDLATIKSRSSGCFSGGGGAGIDTSFVRNDSIFIVSGLDTIFSGASTWLKPEIDLGNYIEATSPDDFLFYLDPGPDGGFGFGQTVGGSDAFLMFMNSSGFSFGGSNLMGGAYGFQGDYTSSPNDYAFARMFSYIQNTSDPMFLNLGINGLNFTANSMDSIFYVDINGDMRLSQYPGTKEDTAQYVLGIQQDGKVVPINKDSVGTWLKPELEAGPVSIDASSNGLTISNSGTVNISGINTASQTLISSSNSSIPNLWRQIAGTDTCYLQLYAALGKAVLFATDSLFLDAPFIAAGGSDFTQLPSARPASPSIWVHGIAGTGSMKAMQNGVAFDTTDGSGDITVTFATAMPDATFTVIANPDSVTATSCNVQSKNSTSMVLRFFDASGTAITSTGIVANYIVIDY